jgi:hypothetical protein
LTRDRRGIENTFLMHADRPGDRPRLLYWYRTAPGIALGRSPLDEDAIRTIEEQHPDIDFDWPAILALAEVMTPEDEAPAPRPQQQRREKKKGRESTGPRQPSSDRRRDDRSEEPVAASSGSEAEADITADNEPDASPIEMPAPRNLLVEELAGREIGARLRARHAEIVARIEDADIDGGVKDAMFKRAEAIDPELWMTPEQVLEGVRNADAQYDKLRAELAAR